MSTKVIKSKYFIEQEQAERVAEVSTDEIEQWPANEKLKVISATGALPATWIEIP